MSYNRSLSFEDVEFKWYNYLLLFLAFIMCTLFMANLTNEVISESNVSYSDSFHIPLSVPIIIF